MTPARRIPAAARAVYLTRPFGNGVAVMIRLTNKHVLLGVTGGIAAYKSAELVRKLKDAGAQVRVVMTKAAQEFITPLTLQALSGNPVHTDLLDPAAEAAMGHIELARWADVILIAPATADVIARIATGQADDLLTTLCLASTAPLAMAPAMNQAMWRNANTQHNVELLLKREVHLFGPADGSQACGDVGPGRMLEPLDIAERLSALFPSGLLSGRHVVITAGPTREAIDPVRFISNHSSGKMGFALAQAALDAGARTTLIAGPVHLPTPDGANRIDVVSAQDMLDAALGVADCDIFIAAAAVADYRPVTVAVQKIKKTADTMQIEMTRNPDIVTTVAASSPKPFVVGFAAETNDVVTHARDKLLRKQLDLIIANDVSDAGIGFNSDDNAVTVIWHDGEQRIAQTAKRVLARQLIGIIAAHVQLREPV